MHPGPEEYFHMLIHRRNLCRILNSVHKRFFPFAGPGPPSPIQIEHLASTTRTRPLPGFSPVSPLEPIPVSPTTQIFPLFPVELILVFSLNIWESSIFGCSRTFQIGSILKQLLSRNQLECQKFPYCLKMSRMLQMCQNSTTHKNMSHILNWKTPNYQNVQYVRSVL